MNTTSWPFTLSFIARLGDEKGQENLDYVLRMGAFTPTAAGLSIYPPSDGGQANAVTTQRFVQFSEDTRDAVRFAVHDHGVYWTAEFAGVKLDSRDLATDALKSLAQDAIERISVFPFTSTQLGEMLVTLGIFIQVAAEYLAATDDTAAGDDEEPPCDGDTFG